MSKHFRTELEDLQRNIIVLGMSVDEMVKTASRALQERDPCLARQVVGGDKKVDEWENLIEQQCLQMLALHQPVASDLRRLVMVLRINGDLEHVAELAGEVAECALALSDCAPGRVPARLGELADLVTSMAWYSIDAFFSSDKQQAASVCAMEEKSIALVRDLFDEMKKAVQETPEAAEAEFAFFTASGCLRRIARLAVNMAEEVIYLVDGRPASQPCRPAAAQPCAG